MIADRIDPELAERFARWYARRRSALAEVWAVYAARLRRDAR